MSIVQKDQKIIWHPFTQEKHALLPICITKGQGSYLYDEHNNSYLDLISSWWVNLHGHANAQIAKAIYKQAQKIEQVIFAGFTHEPAVTLCEKLLALLPKNLSRFFFSDNGSTAVEVALKMAYQYWYNQGLKDKTIFLSFEGGYHGDTFGAMSVGQKSGFHDSFAPLFFSVKTFTYPATWQNDKNQIEKEHNCLKEIKNYLENNNDKVAAFILEPLIQGASGMKTCSSNFINQLVSLLKSYNILVIFDEIMTGFGRTGTFFAKDQIEEAPDFLCLSKGLTGGFLPLALTVTTEKIYQAFLDDSFNKAFAHGHSYTANPLGCAAALASLNLLQTDICQRAIKDINEAHKMGLNLLSSLPNVEKIRGIGTIAAFDITGDKFDNNNVKQAFLAKGLLLRPLANTVYLLPPYCTTTDELTKAYKKIAEIVAKLN